MQRLAVVVRRLTDTDVTVLVHGASGTGKEPISRALHAARLLGIGRRALRYQLKRYGISAPPRA